jgi:hypothetical protein
MSIESLSNQCHEHAAGDNIASIGGEVRQRNVLTDQLATSDQRELSTCYWDHAIIPKKVATVTRSE